MWMIRSFFQTIADLLYPSRCLGCGRDNALLCNTCIQHARRALETPYAYITPLFDYRDPLIKRTIHAIKYHHRRDLIEPLVHNAKLLIPTTIYDTQSILVPIPSPIVRKLLRGYNQSELIAHALGKMLNLNVDTTILIRSYAPLRQVQTRTREARLKNQKGTFVAQDVKGKHIILIDDVVTTGATLEEARRTLLASGASSVYAITLAH